MERIDVESTQKTPKLLLDPISGEIAISGWSVPENATEFYHYFSSTIEEYCKYPQIHTKVDFALECFNTGSSIVLLKILKMFDQLQSEGRSLVQIRWKYEEDDEELLESIQDLDNLLYSINIEKISVKDYDDA